MTRNSGLDVTTGINSSVISSSREFTVVLSPHKEEIKLQYHLKVCVFHVSLNKNEK
jgi:hypothetical protein